MTDIMLKGAGKLLLASLAGRCAVDVIGWKPKSSLLRADWGTQRVFHCRTLFVCLLHLLR